jgi:hypothetical protein
MATGKRIPLGISLQKNVKEKTAMSNIISTIKALPKMSGYKAATNIEISDAEIRLCLRFADEYKTYLAEFGEASARGIELTGIIDAEYLNVVSATKEKWQIYTQVPHNFYVIEDPGIDGIVVWQDSNGTVYKTTPNTKPVRIADSLDEYLKNRRK